MELYWDRRRMSVCSSEAKTDETTKVVVYIRATEDKF